MADLGQPTFPIHRDTERPRARKHKQETVKLHGSLSVKFPTRGSVTLATAHICVSNCEVSQAQITGSAAK